MATKPVAALEKFMAPPQNAGANDPKPQPIFAGFQKPSIDMDAVRDGRRAPIFYIDIPLDSTFSIAGGNALVLPISGNSFYIDQDLSVMGNAYVHFQDTNLQASSVPLFVGAGFIAKVPFTQLLIENKVAQAGKIIRIVYGVDIDFTAGVNATIAITDQPPVRFSGTTQQHTVTATSANIVSASATRKFAMIQNNGTIDIFVAVGVTATITNGFKIAPNASITFDAAVATNAFSAITASGTNSNIVHLFG
jgi:hypothetical protein